MNLGLNTYHMVGAFDSMAGNHYLIMCNKNRTRYMPILLDRHQKELLIAYHRTGSTRDMGMYTTVLDMWAGMDCKPTSMVLKIKGEHIEGPPEVEVDMILTQVGEDGLSVLHVMLSPSDAAVLSVLAKVDILVGVDLSVSSTMPVNWQDGDKKDTEGALGRIMNSIDQYEYTLASSQGGRPNENN